MPSLAAMQSQFAEALRDAAREPPDWLARPGKAVPARRLDVYRNNVYAGLIGALEAHFPAVLRLVGEGFFRAMARVHVESEPPRSPVMLYYGAGFADFIAAFEPVADVPYLADVARLEWLLHSAHHAADARGLAAADLAAIAPERIGSLVLSFVPSFSVLSSPYPVFAVWRDNARPVEPAADGAHYSGAQSVLVTRPDLVAEAVSLPSGAFEFYSALQSGSALGDAAQQAAGMEPQFRLDAALALLLRQGAVRSFAFAPLS